MTGILWSGGIDSTAVLKWYLENTDLQIVAIHYNLGNSKRNKLETQQVKELYTILNEIRTFQIVYPTFKYNSNKKNTLGDVHNYAFNSIILAMILELDEVVIGYVSDIRTNQKKYIENSLRLINLASGIFYLSQESFLEKQVVYNYPQCLNTKAEYIKILGNLIDKVWYCRNPIDKTPCGKCHTCKHVEKSLLNILQNEI